VAHQEQPEHRRTRAELLGVERQHRHHDPEADQIDDHDAEEDEQRRARAGFGNGMPRS
jgi:hypothetical protein